MLKKTARIVNLILWGILFLAFVFADVYKLDVGAVEIQIAGIGIFHILSVIMGLVGIAAAAILVFGKTSEEEQ